jgi:glycosyltransferase involved in cell wall biosynthesis
MSRPLISFVTTVYNKAAFLPQTLAALGAQTGDFEAEYIFVDDGSTDDSAAIIGAVTAAWPKVTLIRQENQGAAAATNRGIAAAPGDYVKLLDGDDVLHVEATARLFAALDKNPQAVAAFAHGCTQPNESLSAFAPPNTDVATLLPNPLALVLKRNLFNPSQVLVRLGALSACGGCDADPRIRFGQDYTLNLRLARLGAFVSLPQTLVHFPEDVPGRVSAHQGRELERLNIALMLFFQQFPETSPALKRLAAQRTAGRAYAFARRHSGAQPLLSRAFWRYAQSFLPQRDMPGFIEKTLADFKDAAPPS